MNDAVSAPDPGVSMREALGEIYDQMEGAPEGEVIAGDEAPEIETAEVEAPEEIEEFEEAEPPGQQAPAHWSKERRELFAQADPAIQKAWLDREAEFERGIQAKAQEAAQYRQAIEPVRQLIQLRGMDETAWIRQMAGYTMALEQDPLGVIRAVAQQYGVDLGAIGQRQPDDEFIDPQVKELRDQIQTLQRQIEESQQAAQRETQSAQARMIEQFRDEKDAAGNPVNPHFDAVLDDIMVLAQGYKSAGRQIPALRDLYDRAVRMRPDLQSAQPVTAQVSDLEKAQRAKRARSAAARPTASVATGEPKQPISLRDEIAVLLEQANKRS